jgi:rod shape-determining protein MreD
VTRATWRAAAKAAVVLLVGILVQTAFGNDMRVDGIAPDFMMLLAVCAGFVGGPSRGAAVGFAAGLLSDLFLQGTPLGLSALAACIVGFVVGWGRTQVLTARLAFAPVVAAAGTAVGVAIFVVIGYLMGQAQLVAPGKSWLVQVAFVEAVYSAIFALPAVVLMSWALGTEMPSPAEPVPGASPPEVPLRRRPLTGRSRRRRRARVGVR